MKILHYLIIFCLFLYPVTVHSTEVQEKVEQPVEDAITLMQSTQTDEEDWRQLQEQLSTELELLESRVQQLTEFRDQQKVELAQTNNRIDIKKQQLADVLRIEQEMQPFLVQLTQRLTELPEEGLPFLLDERNTRMAKLEGILRDPEISISEQYRKAMEALLIETEFGITLETYQEKLTHDNESVLVNILRLGRLGLFYVSLDESSCGFYNIATKDWQILPDYYVHPLQTAIAIAAKQRPAEFIDMPLGKIVR